LAVELGLKVKVRDTKVCENAEERHHQKVMVIIDEVDKG
jgi:hypothetical protein